MFRFIATISLLVSLITQATSEDKKISLTTTTTEKGGASYYAQKFNGRRTASGEIFSSSLATAAHRTLPFGTLVKVTNLDNKKSVVVRINDRGPFIKGRIIDLSYTSAKQIGMIEKGVIEVTLEIFPPRETIQISPIAPPEIKPIYIREAN